MKFLYLHSMSLASFPIDNEDIYTKVVLTRECIPVSNAQLVSEEDFEPSKCLTRKEASER